MFGIAGGGDDIITNAFAHIELLFRGIDL